MNSDTTTHPREKLVFGRFSREECGLPPMNWGRPRIANLAVRCVVLLAVLMAVGYMAGVLVGRYREAWTATLPAQIRGAAPDDISDLLSRGRMNAVSQPDRPGLTASLGYATLVAAERSPRRMGYYGNASRLLGGLEKGEGATMQDFAVSLMASGAHAEVGDYAKAFASLARADAALVKQPDSQEKRGYKLHLVNAQAYFLATAPDNAGRNPERALHLAQLMITSKDPLPGGGRAPAEFFDTLASAWHAVGDDREALLAQTFALGLAESSGLDIYIRHYDLYNK